MKIQFPLPAVLISALLAISLLISGCCERCRPVSLGRFNLRPESSEWLAQTTAQPVRNFTNGQNIFRQFIYVQIAEGFQDELPTNCRDRGNCGMCCDIYSEASHTVALVSEEMPYSFTLALVKDFVNYDPSSAQPDSVPDRLLISGGAVASGGLFLDQLPAAEAVTLNGTQFTEVYRFGAAQAPEPSNTNVTLVYFSKNKGVVGFALANGEVWSLAN